MAAKKISKQFKVYAMAGKADPKPPLGPTMGQNGVPIGIFMKDFNAQTQPIAQKYGDVKVPAIITVYIDKSFDFVVLPPLTSHLIRARAGIAKGSAKPNKEKNGTITMKDVMEIAEIKKEVMNTEDMDSIARSIIGTAKSLGITVVD